MKYANYNDYELIYLYRNGSEAALNVLLKKYYVLVEKIVKEYYICYDAGYYEKRNDLVQEGIMVVYRCLETFNSSCHVSFFSYVTIAVKRRMYNLTYRDEYYGTHIILEDSVIATYPTISNAYNQNSNVLLKGKSFLTSEIDILIYEECIIGNRKYKEFSDYYKIDYHQLLYRKKEILKNLKEVVDKK